MIVRNDDVAYDTKLSEIETFCNICDKHGFKIMQCITPKGFVKPIDSKMTNEEIREVAGNSMFKENREVYDYLKGRDDLIAVHGFYHEHRPTVEDISRGEIQLIEWGFSPTYYVPPFNEETAGYQGLTVSAKTQRLEDYHKGGIPTDEICYLHSWRYDNAWYRFEDLDRTLERIANARGQ
jgi:hypothetical protein